MRYAHGRHALSCGRETVSGSILCELLGWSRKRGWRKTGCRAKMRCHLWNFFDTTLLQVGHGEAVAIVGIQLMNTVRPRTGVKLLLHFVVSFDFEQLLPCARTFLFCNTMFERQIVQLVALIRFSLRTLFENLWIKTRGRRRWNEWFIEKIVLNSSVRNVVYSIHDICHTRAQFSAESCAILVSHVRLRHLRARGEFSVSRRQHSLQLLLLKASTLGDPVVFGLLKLKIVLVLEAVSLIAHLKLCRVQLLLNGHSLSMKLNGHA